MSDNIKVVVKVRPLISREIDDKLPYQWRVQTNTLHQLDGNGRDFGQTFTFDKVYNENTKTTDVYNDVAKPIVEAATAGFNGTIFAYGQTSSGKTYTMTGTDTSPGIIPLSVLNLFEIIKNIPDRDFLVRVSYIEIYNETLKDLLDVNKKENIKIHETYDGSIKVDATEKVTSSPEEVLEAMREGEANRQTGTTNMNEKSSRSHSIFQITIESREHIEGAEQAGCVNVSQLNLVDLAGSERAGQTGATGLRFKEGTHINKSLSALALVIKQLSEDPNKFANYRDSKLTRILQNSLGGNAKTSIICAITPAALEETVSTLQFATRAKAIKNKPEVNAVATDATMIQSLTKQLSKLQSQLEKKKNLEVMLETKKNVEQDLQKQIANLQKLILNGFAQRSSIEHIGGVRRKLQPPRRITISSLHSIEDPINPVPAIPRFCTPSLKYNPMAMQNPSDFVPIRSTNILATLPEEPARLITPPPNDRKVNFDNDVIEIDSDDDDDNSTIPTCSPYHKCYTQSKTPPCILRKNLNQAERNYQDIIELTEREKMYKPDVVELMEKLEQATIMTVKLQDDVEVLKKSSKEKDLELEHLKSKINKREEEVKNTKLELETHCKNYDTKVTDLEVICETLKKKAKLREDELLSLLEEQKHKKSEEIGKIGSKLTEKDLIAFMDLSKDISLVNSDNDSIVNPDDEESSKQMPDSVASLQDQLIEKSQTILQLEENIASQTRSIELLEQSCNELQGMVGSFEAKLIYIENENGVLQSTVETLNTTIKNLEQNLEIAQNEMGSYNSIIQELQIKLSQKESLLNIQIDDSVLESMISNEEKVLANNENMTNIIHSFKIALDNRSKEIEQLKSSKQDLNNSQLKALNEDVNDKTKHIEMLSEEISKLKEQLNDNIHTINKLMSEKSNLASVELELTKKLAELENQKTEFNEQNIKIMLHVNSLKETNETLMHSISNNIAKEQKYEHLNSKLQIEINEMSNKITEIEKDIVVKDYLISTLRKQSDDHVKYEHQATSAIVKLKSIMSILSGEVQEIPDLVDNFVTLFTALSTGLSTLEDVATDTVAEKNHVLKENSQLKTEIVDLHNKYDMETKTHLQEIENLKKSVENHLMENANLLVINKKLSDEICGHKNDIDTKRNEYDILLEKYSSLQNELLQQQDVVSLFNGKETEYKHEIDELRAKLENINIALESEHDQLQVKENNLTDASITIERLNTELKQKCDEITEVQQRLSDLAQVKNRLIETIYSKVCDITNESRIDLNFSCEDVNDKCYEHILLTLDQINTHIAQINAKNVKNENNIENQLCEIESLSIENQELRIKLLQIETEHQVVSIELDKNSLESISINENLTIGSELLAQLKDDLKSKSDEIECMKNKAEEWKNQFIDLEILMKKQMQDLQQENETLKARHLQLKNETQIQIDNLLKESNDSDLNLGKSFTTTDNADLNLRKSNTSTVKNTVETVSPQSLLTICCNRIVESLEPKQNDNYSVTTFSSDCEFLNATNMQSCLTCDQLSLDLQNLQKDNATLSAHLEQLEVANKELIIEQEKIRQEVQLLLEPAQELQKKIASHKTNLSILTATTYAENKSLKSQVKGLQHHHGRFHHVCQRDIPEFKRQLRELLVILKGDSSVSEVQNVNLKRYSLPDVLDNNCTGCNFKNESTLDGDLLMLDTNVTLTTTGDNTVGDQTCLDLTQTMFNEVSCQTNIAILTAEPNAIHRQMNVLESDNQNCFQALQVLKVENSKLKALMDSFAVVSHSKVDTQTSPMKISSSNDYVLCTNCQMKNEQPVALDMKKEPKNLTKRLADIQAEKENIEKKYNNLLLEMPNTDALVSKLTALEMECNIKANELKKLTSSVTKKNIELKILQEENDSLSTQVMENISEADDLNKELSSIKVENLLLSEKLQELESKSETNKFECPQCHSKDKVLLSVQSTTPHAKLNRSLSDSDTSSRYNKICTLQNELYAGREDCKTLTEDVATIKQHLDNSNMSMDLDESMGDSNVFSQAKPLLAPNLQNTKCNMPDIQEEHPLDIYTIDKIDCCNYYMEITGIDKEIVSKDTKIIEIMKMFYNNMVAKHGNDVENLANKLKDYEESNIKLQTQIDEMVSKYSTTKKDIVGKEKDLSSVAKLISQINSNINHINDEINTSKDSKVLAKIIQMFKQNFLNTLDYEFGINSAKVFEVIVDNNQEDLMSIEKQCTSLQNQTEDLITELGIANGNLAKLKSELTEKESEYNLLKAQKEKIVEISSAVTLDIVRKEQEMNKLVSEAYQKLYKLNLVPSDLDLTKAASGNVNILIDQVISQHNHNYQQIKNDKEMHSLEVNKYKTVLEEKEQEMAELKSQIQSLKEINNDVNLHLADENIKFQTLKLAHDDLSKLYDSKIQENTHNLDIIDKLTAEISGLRDIISSKESIIESLSTRDAKNTELLKSIKELQEDNEKLKSVNQMIVKENESYSVGLEKSSETIKQNNTEIKKITSDILALREALKDATLTIESLKQEVNKVSVDNSQLKIKFEEKSRDCSRLEINIKTHEKTAEIQNRMIMRLQKQKDDDQVIGEQQKKIDEITEKYKTLQSECEELKTVKESLEAKLSETEEAQNKPHVSLDAMADSSRLRRQSIHDSKRLLRDLDEHRNLEAVFESRQKSDDLFMDIDGDDTSGRSTPFGLGRGRDSFLSKTESDKDDDHSSRPSSVLATRRRRQSIHDMHRGVARHTPSPHDLSSKLIDEQFYDTSGNRSGSSEINQLREQLTSCQQELEDLKEKYRELDEECETCAEYLRERDEQCIRLKKEKVALEKQVTELKSSNQNMSQHTLKPSVAHVAVNTDEDWANLHAVVVDRMSYDAEVEKNKKLTKTIEELRFKKQDLKNTMAKMHKALDKHSSKTRELEATKEELVGVKEELDELKLRYKELDEECETCAQYLKEREEQCRRLKEAKAALERKLEELQADAHTAAHSHTVRKKRQTVHDLNRNSVVDQNDASTETSDDFLSYQVERDDSTRRMTEDQQRETKRHKMIIEKLTHQKAALEKQLKIMQAAPAPNPMYVATGSAIVQNQQLTDVMKENQKLKKINAKLVNICKKRGKSDANRENEDPCEQD